MWTKERFDGGQTVVCDAPLLQKEGLPMFIRVGGGAAYQPDCMSLYDQIPQTLRIELYADSQAQLLLHESETVSNRFRCRKAGDAFEVYAENNSGIDREYSITVFAAEKAFEWLASPDDLPPHPASAEIRKTAERMIPNAFFISVSSYVSAQ